MFLSCRFVILACQGLIRLVCYGFKAGSFCLVLEKSIVTQDKLGCTTQAVLEMKLTQFFHTHFFLIFIPDFCN